MLNMEKTIKNLIGMEVTDDFENDVICAFENDCENDVIVIKLEGRWADYQAYEDWNDSPIICIKIENGIIVSVYPVVGYSL